MVISKYMDFTEKQIAKINVDRRISLKFYTPRWLEKISYETVISFTFTLGVFKYLYLIC